MWLSNSSVPSRLSFLSPKHNHTHTPTGDEAQAPKLLPAERTYRVEVVGSNPADPTTRGTGAATARIFKTLWKLKKKGQSEDTLKAKGDRLRHLSKHVDLDDPEAVKGFIANQSGWSNAYKQGVAYAYNSYVRANGLKWSLPRFRIEDKLPRIPTEEKINQVIVRARGKYVLVFSILRDTGMRPIELDRTRARDIDLERGTITVRTTKGGAGRFPGQPTGFTHAWS